MAKAQQQRGEEACGAAAEAEEILDSFGASDDLVAIRIAAEEEHWNMQAPTMMKPTSAASLNDRLLAVRLVGNVVDRLGHLRLFFVDIVSTMDACSQKVCAWNDHQALPAFCLAAIRLRVKTDMQARDLTMALQELAPSCGVPPELVTEALLNEAEHRILQCLEWRLCQVNLQGWLRMLLVRVQVQLPEGFEQTLRWTADRCQNWAALLTAWRPESQQLSRPRLLAAGLLALSFVTCRVLPLQALRPGYLGKDEWESLYIEGLESKVPDCEVLEGSPSSDSVLQIIAQAASLGDVSELSGAAKDTLNSMFQVHIESRPCAWVQKEQAKGQHAGEQQRGAQ